MKFNLSDFLQLDTKELLAVNGGSPCSGPTTGPSNNASDPTSPSYGSGGNDGNGGGSSGPGAGASGSGGGGCSPSNNPSKPGGSKNPENNKPGNNSDAGSGGGACSPTNSKAPDTGNPDSSNPDNNIRSGGGECSAQEPKTFETRDDKYGTTIIVTIYPDGHGTREFIDTKTGEVISSGPIGPYDSGKNDNSTKSTSSEANTNSGRTESGTGASSVGNDGTKGTQDSSSTHESEGSGSHNSNGQGSSTTSANPGGTSGTTSDSTKNNGENGSNTNGSNTPSEITDDGHLICFVPSKEHCDIIAWNHAVDAGLNPRGKNGTDWNANGKTVDEIFKMHFVKKAVNFDGKQAGKMGYIVYDWEGDGEYDHIEFGSISEDGLSYSYYSNNGFDGKDSNGKEQEHYYTRTFANDSNAHADNNGNGIVRFIPLN